VVKTITPVEAEKRAEREKAEAKAKAKQKAEEKKELENDLESLAKIWKNSRSMEEICRNCNDAGLTGPITRNRKSIQGMRHDKKFISNHKLDADIPDKVSSIELSDDQLTPLVMTEIKEILQELINKKFDGDTWTFSDLSGQSMLKNIMDKIAEGLDYDDAYILNVQHIIVQFFQEVVKKGNLEDPELDVYISPNGDRLVFSSGFCEVAISEL